jgi:hypothetical protein
MKSMRIGKIGPLRFKHKCDDLKHQDLISHQLLLLVNMEMCVAAS